MAQPRDTDDVHTTPSGGHWEDGPRSHLPFWEQGSCFYGNTLGQNTRFVVESTSQMIIDFISKVTVKSGDVFTVADFGANDGFASMPLITGIIGHLRKTYGEKLPVQVIYEDQEKNDCNSLFNRLNDSSSFMSMYTNVYPLATNRNFYKQCLPDNTCDVIFSMAAVHWLEKKSTLKDAIYGHSVRVTEEEFDQCRRQAEKDWTKFLLLRSQELKPGGLLVVYDLGRSNDFRPSDIEKKPRKLERNDFWSVSEFGMSCWTMYASLEEAWVQLRKDGFISQDEFESCTESCYFRSGQEQTLPFSSEDSPVVKAGLSIVHHDQLTFDCHFKRLWRRKMEKEGVDDRDYFARLVTQAHRVHSQSSFESSLSSGRSDAEKAAILDELYRRVEALVGGQDPETVRSGLIISRLVARKL